MLYQLSYASLSLERETGIEPATNSLEGCDSTIELLPLFQWFRYHSRDEINHLTTVIIPVPPPSEKRR